MVQLDRSVEYVVILNGLFADTIQPIVADLAGIVPMDNIRIFDVPQGVSYFDNRRQLTIAAEIVREKFIADLAPDIVHVTSVIEGLGEPIVTSVNLYDRNVPVAATLYDLIPFKYSEIYLNDYVSRQHYADKVNYLKQASLLLSISDYSAFEFKDIFPDYAGSIVNIRGGVDPRFKPDKTSSRDFKVFKTAHGLNRFILYTASYDQRKNQARLIEAFGLLPPDLRNQYKLVLVGNGWPDIYKRLAEFALDKGLRADQIVFAGHISDALLIRLYSNCDLFVFPSLAEGLGLPIIEAMACGAPTIASNTTCLPEVVGDRSALFDPAKSANIAEKMESVLRDEGRRARMSEAAIAHAATFNWQDSAQRALAALKSAVKPKITLDVNETITSERFYGDVSSGLSKTLSDRELTQIAASLCSNEVEAEVDWTTRSPLRVGWVSTWFSRCGIAAYSEHLTEPVADSIIRLAPNDPVNSGAVLKHSIVRCWSLGTTDNLSGVAAEVISSDLDAIVIQVNYGFYNFVSLAALIESLVQDGIPVFVTLHSTIDPPQDMLANRLSTLAPALMQANEVFVHSVADVQRLGRLGVTSNVSLVPLGVCNFPDRGTKPDANARLVASYGFFLPNKGILELIEASGIAKANGRGFDLLLVNSDYGDSGGVSAAEILAARQRVSALGLDDQVTFMTDYIADEQSVALLRMANLVVYPYQRSGESASAAVRFGIASGRPVAVTPLSVFDDVRPITHTLPGTTPEALATGITRLLDEIASGESSFAGINDAADRWRFVNDYGVVIRCMMRKIRRTVARHDVEVIRPPLNTLPTRVGRFVENKVRTTGQAGVLLYGPYVDLGAGRYKLILSGQSFSRIEAGADLCLTYDHGQNIILSVPIDLVNEAICVSQNFVLPRAVKSFEVVISCTDDAVFDVHEYAVLRG
ncbi:hypothetical protein MSC49_40410 (plasmid) [Methylosinus sp. C49]|nr:hypothetical protein MSC49_40410 [Methylosinus sp. C49]